jgi:CRISPR/Cas system CMR-associated protein Cmr5 small subunit
MPLQNLDQIRAKSALHFASRVDRGEIRAAGKNGGEAMKKIPPMIMTNGLLASLAYAMENKAAGYSIIFDAIAEHLACADVSVTPREKRNAADLTDYLSQSDSRTLKRATSEALAWLGFARRFVRSGNEGTGLDEGVE